MITEDFDILRFGISAISGTRSGAQSVGSPEVAKRNKLAELGCGHEGSSHMDEMWAWDNCR